MPRYSIGALEIPVDPVTATTVIAPAPLAVVAADESNKEALKDAKNAQGLIFGASVGSVVVVGGLAAAAYWFLFKKKRGLGHVIRR